MRFQILIFDGFDELDAIAPYEVLCHAVQENADAAVEMVTPYHVSVVTSAHGLRLLPPVQLDSRRKPDVLIVPGGGWIDRSPKGAYAEVLRRFIPDTLKSFHESGTICAAVCTGAMLLAAAGILKGRPATTHHGAIQDLKDSGAELIQARVVDDGNVITAGGVTSGLDLGLWLVERFYGSQLAQKIETQLEYERRGTVWRSGGKTVSSG
jgi:transcriptional regulator GlxA family with amidase domain